MVAKKSNNQRLFSYIKSQSRTQWQYTLGQKNIGMCKSISCNVDHSKTILFEFDWKNIKTRCGKSSSQYLVSVIICGIFPRVKCGIFPISKPQSQYRLWLACTIRVFQLFDFSFPLGLGLHPTQRPIYPSVYHTISFQL